MQEICPSQLEQLCRKVDIEIQGHRDSSALALINEAGEMAATNAAVQFRLGIVLRNLGRLNESIQVFGELNLNTPDDIHVLHQLAISHHLFGNLASSDEALDAVLAMSPGHPDILLGKIHNAEVAGAPKQLLERAEHALRVHPQNLTFSRLYGDALRKAGLLDASRRHFATLFMRHRSDAEVCLDRARACMGRRDFRTALSLLEKVLRRSPENSAARLLAIDCAVASGRMALALRLVGGGEVSVALSVVLARLYRTAQEPQRALRVLDAFAPELAGNLQSDLIRADAFSDLGRYVPAMELYRSVLLRSPGDANANLRLLDIAMRGVGDESPAVLMDALQDRCLAGASGLNWLVMEAAAQAGDWERLLWLCSTLENGDVQASESRSYFRALAHFGLGHLSAARSELHLALAEKPDSFRDLMLLADIELALGHREASFAIRRDAIRGTGLQQQNALVAHSQDLLRTGGCCEARLLLATQNQLDGYLPTPAYIDVILKQGEDAVAKDCLRRVEQAFSISEQPLVVLLGTTQAQEPQLEYMERARLIRLLDFDKSDGLTGGEIYPQEGLAWLLTKGRYGDFRNWSRRARQATRAALELYQLPPRAEDLRDLVVVPDIAQLEAALRDGRGLILVASHMGPPLAHYLTRLLTNVTYFQNLQTPRHAGTLGATSIAVTGRAQDAAILAVRTLRRGGVLVTTPDVDVRYLNGGRAAPTNSVAARLFGVEVELSNMAPKLSRELCAPSFWLQPQWLDGRIHFVIEGLPLAEPDEDADVWHSRWAQSYLSKLEALMCSAPENQNLTAPLWRYLLYFADESALLNPLLKRLAMARG